MIYQLAAYLGANYQDNITNYMPCDKCSERFNTNDQVRTSVGREGTRSSAIVALIVHVHVCNPEESRERGGAGGECILKIGSNYRQLTALNLVGLG